MEIYKNLSLEDMEGEIWKDIEGFEKKYQISNMGRVKSLRCGKERILKQSFDGNGYLKVGLTKDGKIKTFTTHKLVAITFIKNIEDKPCVDHINTIKTDNRVENLRFVTHKENSNNELTKEKMKLRKFSEETRKKLSESQKGRKPTNYKGFICIFEDGSITEEMTCEKLGKLLGIDGEMIRYIAKSNKPYKPRSKRLKHLDGIHIFYAKDYLKLESGDNNVA